MSFLTTSKFSVEFPIKSEFLRDIANYFPVSKKIDADNSGKNFHAVLKSGLFNYYQTHRNKSALLFISHC